jgi:hypothetical protein
MYKTRVLLPPVVLRTACLAKLWLAAALALTAAPLTERRTCNGQSHQQWSL